MWYDNFIWEVSYYITINRMEVFYEEVQKTISRFISWSYGYGIGGFRSCSGKGCGWG